MLKYLSEEQRAQYDKIMKARETAGRELTTEEKILSAMLMHDWTYEYSDSASVARNGRENEQKLKAMIADADLDADTRARLERYFRMGSSSAEGELHKEFGWLLYRGDFVPRGKVALAVAGRYNDEQWGEFERVFDELKALGVKLADAKCLSRLVMTDDIPPFPALRELATRVREEENDPFFFGIAVPADCQAEMDRIVRVEKRALVLMAQDKDVLHALGSGSTVQTDLHQEHWLFKIQFSGAYYDSFGFFCCPHATRPRSEWNKKPEGAKRPMEQREMSRDHQDRRDRHDRPRGSRNPEVGRVINESRRAAEQVETHPLRTHTQYEATKDEAAYQRAAKVSAPPQIKRKVVPALSNRPMTVSDAPAKKVEKKAPQKRAKQFAKLGSLADLASAITEA